MFRRILALAILLGAMIHTVRGESQTDTVVSRQLGEVVVTGNSAFQRIDNNLIGSERLELSKLKAVPSFAGEADVIKSLALLPGVRSEGDGGGGFEVRGGNAYQNLILLDGMTLYNPAHVMGIFSTFNSDALGGATLYKGPFPATFGGATSSVLETTLSPGEMRAYHGSFTVGILASKIKAEGPVVKDRLSFAVAARRSYVDAFLKIVPKYRSTVMNFYDVTAKVRYRHSALSLLDASFFIGHDNMAVGDIMGMYWGNVGGSINWIASANDKLTFTTTGSLTHYDPKMEVDMMSDRQTMRTYIHDYSLNERVNYAINDSHAMEFGFRSELLEVKSAEWITNAMREREVRKLWDNSLWVDYSGRLTDHIHAGVGLRGEVSGKHYFQLEPRVNLKYSFSDTHNIKAGYGISAQNLHAIRSSSTSFPFDRYALVSAGVRPERATHYGVGYSGMTTDGGWDWQAECFYRSIRNVYDYKDGKSSFSDIELEKIILGGKGRSYGLELMVRKNVGALSGWISYTLSHTQTRIPGINGGRWYNATNDRRNDLAVAATYRISGSWIVSGSWIFMSGQPLTAPDVKYEIAGETCYYYSARNSYKTPPTHRLDLGATYTHSGMKFTYEWTFGIYNAYCRYNPYIVYFEDDSSKPSGTRAVAQAMYGLVPSVSYTLKF